MIRTGVRIVRCVYAETIATGAAAPALVRVGEGRDGAIRQVSRQEERGCSDDNYSSAYAPKCGKRKRQVPIRPDN